MANAPNAIAGSQAPDEPQEPLEPQEPAEPEVPETTEAAAEPGSGEEGAPETPESTGGDDGTATPVEEDATVVPAETQIKKSDVQKRFDALTRRRYQLETQNTQLQNELEELRRQSQGGGQPGQTGQPAAPAATPANINIDPAQLGLPARPTKEQFETNDAYLESVAMWQAVYEVRRQTVLQRQVEVQNRQIAAQNTVVENWNASVEKARQKYDDFDDVVGTDLKIPQAAFTAIVDSPEGTEIAYYLGSHPEEINRLNKLTSAVAVMREIGKLEDRLAKSTGSQAPGAVASTPKPAAKPAAAPAQVKAAVPAQVKPAATTQKPKPSAPIAPVGTSRPVTAGGSASSGKDPSTMSYREYKKWREENGQKR
jgi:hypothetical protein